MADFAHADIFCPGVSFIENGQAFVSPPRAKLLVVAKKLANLTRSASLARRLVDFPGMMRAIRTADFMFRFSISVNSILTSQGETYFQKARSVLPLGCSQHTYGYPGHVGLDRSQWRRPHPGSAGSFWRSGHRAVKLRIMILAQLQHAKPL